MYGSSQRPATTASQQTAASIKAQSNTQKELHISTATQ
jgi:hypothetical protein